MPIPLPNEITNRISQNLLAPNLSLKYYKWADFYKDDFKGFKDNTRDAQPKYDFLKKFVVLSGKGDYKQAFETRKNLLEGIGITFTMTTASRLVFGMGYEHPAEIGFMFDWTSGLPIIPGSSLKGTALQAIEYDIDVTKNTDEKKCKEEVKNKIFGSPVDGGGNIIFFPAYPCLMDNKPFLELDVMTPHYSEYYSEPAKNPPADWYSPLPLHFLTVPAGVKYCFRLAHRKNLRDKELPLLKKAENMLKCALSEFGVGAKTSVFYGYFR